VIELVKLGVFVVFGSLLTMDVLFHDGWAAVGIAGLTLLVARPVAVFTALAGTRQVGRDGKAFMAWFGPKGVATMTSPCSCSRPRRPKPSGSSASPP
jgi:sodium/hydrogen antiporter